MSLKNQCHGKIVSLLRMGLKSQSYSICVHIAHKSLLTGTSKCQKITETQIENRPTNSMKKQYFLDHLNYKLMKQMVCIEQWSPVTNRQQLVGLEPLGIRKVRKVGDPWSRVYSSPSFKCILSMPQVLGTSLLHRIEWNLKKSIQ